MSRIYFLFLLLFSATVFAQKTPKESVSLEKPLVIDGNVDDWGTIDWWLDPDGKFFCNVSNDNDNLYVRMKTADDLTQVKIGYFGMSLKLNPSGKRKGKVGVKYPVARDENELKQEQKENEKEKKYSDDIAGKLQAKKDMIKDVEVVELIGLAKQNIVSSRLGLANGVEVMIIAQNDGAYTYEAKIPFRAFKINKSDVEVLGVEFETGRYVQKASTNTNNNSAYSPMNSGYGGGGYGRGGYGMQQPMMSSYSYSPLSTPGYFFVPVKLK